MKRISKILICSLLLIVSCEQPDNPFISSNQDIFDRLDIGDVRAIDLHQNTLYVATNLNGVHILEISDDDNNSLIQLNNNKFLNPIYNNEDEGYDKELRDIYYSQNINVLYILDRNQLSYQVYLPNLYNNLVDLFAVDNQIYSGACQFEDNNTKFYINDISPYPEIYTLSKHNADVESYTEISYSKIAKYSYELFLPAYSLVTLGCASPLDSFLDTDLTYQVKDISFIDNSIIVASYENDINKVDIYSLDNTIISSDIYSESIKSVYTIEKNMNDYVLTGTDNGCYITLLEDGSFTDNPDNKLQIANGFTVYDIFYDKSNDLLILSCGNSGVLVYDWTGNNLSEYVRAYSSYAYSARMKDDLLIVGTKNGLELFNLE